MSPALGYLALIRAEYRCASKRVSRVIPDAKAPGRGIGRALSMGCNYEETGRTFAACLPFGPSTMSNSTSWPSDRVR